MMTENGILFTFDIEKISLLDINNLIDKGKRFCLESGLTEDEYDDIEESLKDDI